MSIDTGSTERGSSALSLRLASAEHELAQIASVEEAHDLVDKAAAAAEFARRVKLGNSSINHATTIRLLAERRMAQLVDESQAAGQVRRQEEGRPGSVQDKDTSKPLSGLGIDRRRLCSPALRGA